jgi:hypothetical protein
MDEDDQVDVMNILNRQDLTEHDDDVGSDEGPSTYVYERTTLLVEEEEEGEADGSGGGAAADAGMESAGGEEGEEEDGSEPPLPMDRVEAIVAAQLRELEGEYEAAVEGAGAGVAASLSPSSSAGQSARLASLAARRPEMAARLAAAIARVDARAGAGLQPGAHAWESFDFPDDYDELQTADSLAAKAAGAGGEGEASGEWGSEGPSEAAFGVGSRTEPFEPFDGAASATPLLPLKLPSLRFVGSGVRHSPRATAAARPAAPPRAVSPLPGDVKDRILAAMAGVKLKSSPPQGGGSFAERLVQQALERAAASRRG